LKVRSAVIRLVKIAYQKNDISMPDDARQVVFPKGLPVILRPGMMTKVYRRSIVSKNAI